ncbi:hypothetical protein [Euzebya pacifica]|uniref:hypothetical protein n=1 Tax=Euzebya pacifica TaxID=1608957 RepID=UPI0030FAA7B1
MTEEIANEDELLRRAHPTNGPVWDDNLGRFRLSSASFRDPSGGSEASVYATRLLPPGKGPLDLAADHPNQALLSFLAETARTEGFDVEHRPDQDPGVFASAHCNVVWPDMSPAEFRAARANLLDQMQVVEGTLPGGPLEQP